MKEEEKQQLGIKTFLRHCQSGSMQEFLEYVFRVRKCTLGYLIYHILKTLRIPYGVPMLDHHNHDSFPNLWVSKRHVRAKPSAG